MKLVICAKTVDQCVASLRDGEGIITENYGYVPRGIGLGDDMDFIELEIDFKTGQILNWPKLSEKDVADAINKAKA